MALNPELRRNLWLELSGPRVVMIGGVLGALLILVERFGNPVAGGSALDAASLTLYVLITCGWGSYVAGDSIYDEFRRRTWDTQRMSALTPWQMTWGKLFGSTVAVWLAGLLCLGAYLLAAPPDLASVTSRLTTVAGLVALAILLHATNMFVALAGVRLINQVRPLHGLFTAVVLGVAAWSTYHQVIGGALNGVPWYGREVATREFVLISIVVFAAWALVGLYRLMAAELEVAQLPWAWPAFIAFSAVYFGGSVASRDWSVSDIAQVDIDIALGIAVGAAYLTALAYLRDPLAIPRMAAHARAGQWQRMLYETPPWVVCLVVAALCAAASIGCVLAVVAPPPTTMIGAGAAAVWLSAARDIAVMLGISFAVASRRPLLTSLIYLLAINSLLPSLLEATGAGAVARLVAPDFVTRPATATVVLTVHLAIALSFALYRYRRNVAPRLEAD